MDAFIDGLAVCGLAFIIVALILATIANWRD